MLNAATCRPIILASVKKDLLEMGTVSVSVSTSNAAFKFNLKEFICIIFLLERPYLNLHQNGCNYTNTEIVPLLIDSPNVQLY